MPMIIIRENNHKSGAAKELSLLCCMFQTHSRRRQSKHLVSTQPLRAAGLAGSGCSTPMLPPHSPKPLLTCPQHHF